MKATPKIGDVGELRFVVDRQHLITFDDREMPAVLSTPTLIWYLEHAAIEALSPLLESNECSLGIHVDVQHLAPTPPGDEVLCRARVIHITGRTITFQVEAHDSQEQIARGLHKRSVVEIKRFAARLHRKLDR